MRPRSTVTRRRHPTRHSQSSCRSPGSEPNCWLALLRVHPAARGARAVHPGASQTVGSLFSGFTQPLAELVPFTRERAKLLARSFSGLPSRSRSSRRSRGGKPNRWLALFPRSPPALVALAAFGYRTTLCVVNTVAEPHGLSLRGVSIIRHPLGLRPRRTTRIATENGPGCQVRSTDVAHALAIAAPRTVAVYQAKKTCRVRLERLRRGEQIPREVGPMIVPDGLTGVFELQALDGPCKKLFQGWKRGE